MSLESEIQKIVESCGAKLYDIEKVNEGGKNIYRVTITADEGVDLDKCVTISNLISPLLDVHPPMSGEYNLEVSSPGIERKLKKPLHFQNSLQEDVRVTTIDGEVVEGKLVAANEQAITIQTKKSQRQIPYEEILSAKTFFEW